MANRQHRRQVYQTLKLARDQGPKGMLNHAVMQLAQDINKQGLRRQFLFLLKNIGSTATTNLVKELMLSEEFITTTTKSLSKSQLALLLRVFYDAKIQEAHTVSQAKPRNVVRHLVQLLGRERVTRLLEDDAPRVI